MAEMRIKLGQIAEIRTGYTLREGFSKMIRGDTPLIQMSDLEALVENKIDQVKTINMKVRSPDWTLQEGDLLMKARGAEFVPVFVPKAFQGAVFTHPLLRIRVDRELADPEFIAWLLSQSNIQAQLQRFSAGTSLQMLKLSNLKEIELNLPSLNRQYQVQQIVRLMKHEQKLLNRLTVKRKQLVCSSIEKLIQQEQVLQA